MSLAPFNIMAASFMVAAASNLTSATLVARLYPCAMTRTVLVTAVPNASDGQTAKLSQAASIDVPRCLTTSSNHI
ncbi:hypothetical protein U0Q88_007175 [Lactiplantibacillus plantarum]